MTVLKIQEEDYNYLLKKIERYEDALKTIIKLTTCDDTWDFANRTLDGKERLELPYRMNRA